MGWGKEGASAHVKGQKSMPYCWVMPPPLGWSSGGSPPLLTSSWAGNASCQPQREHLQREGDSGFQEGHRRRGLGSPTQLLLPRTCLIIERMDSVSTADHPTVTAAQLSLLSKAAEPCPQLCRPQTWTQSLGLPVWFPDLRLTTASCPAAAGRSLGVNLDTRKS